MTTRKKFPKLPDVIETEPNDQISDPIKANDRDPSPVSEASVSAASVSEPDKANGRPPSPVFPTTDVPLACLFIHLEHGYTIPQFLQDFPVVSEEQVQELLETAGQVFMHPAFYEIWESYS